MGTVLQIFSSASPELGLTFRKGSHKNPFLYLTDDLFVRTVEFAE